jgi:hypothetical protein
MVTQCQRHFQSLMWLVPAVEKFKKLDTSFWKISSGALMFAKGPNTLGEVIASCHRAHANALAAEALGVPAR